VPWVLPKTPIAAAPSEAVLGAIETMAIVTGVFAAGARALAILKGFPPDRVEWMTAAGFAVGVVAAISIFVFGAVWD
jgi:hypothetical protein